MAGRIGVVRAAVVLVAGVALLAGCASDLNANAPPTKPVAGATASPAAGSTPTPAVPEAVKRYRSPRDVDAVAVPVRVEIPSLDIDSSLERVGKLPDGTIGVPRRWDRAAWFSEGAPPGQPGAAVILGHVDSKKGPAVFYRLHELRRGSTVIVHLADKTSVRFVVDHVEQHEKDDFPGVGVYFPTVRPTLRLITCGGDFVRSAGGYQANVIVFASLPNPSARGHS